MSGRTTPPDLLQRIADQATRTPAAMAAVHATGTLSYAELLARAAQVAAGVQPGARVAVEAARTFDTLATVLGVLQAGAAYVPLDPAYPAERLAFMRADSAADASATPDLAYVIYTSGSTGQPKGVAMPRGPLWRMIDWQCADSSAGPGDATLQFAPLSFDVSFQEIFSTWATGGTLVLLSEEERRDPTALVRVLIEFKVARLFLPFVALQGLAEAARGVALPDLREVITAGEQLTVTPALRDFFAACPGRTLANHYGPSETHVVTAHTLTGPPETWPDLPPIGTPLPGVVITVVDDQLRPVPASEVGELLLGGTCLADGYLNRPELTAERFIFLDGERVYRSGDLGQQLPDGGFAFLGRRDQQVKIRGHRVEPGEVEAALCGHANVAAAAVVVRGEGPAKRLVGYVVPKQPPAPTPGELRTFLAERLPEYLVPGAFVPLADLPRTPSGKLDRQALPTPPDARAGVAPRYDAERELLAVWAEVFGAERLGITDNFFDLGGHSLQAARLLAKIRERLGHTLSLSALITAPTVELLARHLQQQLEAGTETTLVPLQERGDRPPLFLIAGVGGHVFTFHKFAWLLGEDQPTYGMKAVGIDGTRPPPTSFEEIAAEYVKEITAARPEGPYLLGGYSIGAVIAFEVALQLQQLGHRVPLLVAFDMSAPDYPPHTPLARRALLHARLFVRRSWRERWQYIRQRFVNLKDKALWRAGLGLWNAPSIEGVDVLPQEALKAVWVALHDGLRRYTPAGRFAGTLALLRATVRDEWQDITETDPYYGWDRWVSGRVVATGLPVRHLDLFQPDHIGELARVVTAEIARSSAVACDSGRLVTT